jgi:transcription elongation factor
MATLQMQPPPAWLYSVIGALKASLELLNETDLRQAATALRAFNESLQLDRASELLQQLEHRLQEVEAQGQRQRQAKQRQGRHSPAQGAAAGGAAAPAAAAAAAAAAEGKKRKRRKQQEAAGRAGASGLHSLHSGAGGSAGSGGGGAHLQPPLPGQLLGAVPGVAPQPMQELASAS